MCELYEKETHHSSAGYASGQGNVVWHLGIVVSEYGTVQVVH